MNENPLSDDSLDGLLSDFFKSQMKKPWPAAPATATNEPSSLATARAAQTDAPRNQPTPSRDSGSKARYTLAASVAIFLGTCWTLSNGFQPGERSVPGVNGSGNGLNLNDTKATPVDVHETLQRDRAINGDDNNPGGFVPPKIDKLP